MKHIVLKYGTCLWLYLIYNIYTANSIKVDMDNSEMCNILMLYVKCPTNDEQNIVLNKISTSVALRDYNYSI